MKAFIYAAALALLSLVAPVARATDNYEALVARLRAGDVKIDYTALRDAYAASPKYQPEAGDFDKPRQAMIDAFNQKDCARALAEAGKVFNSTYIDIVTHIVAGRCYEESGSAAKAGFHRTVAHGLMDSILASGDGKTMATAYVVVTVTEEYDALRALRLRLGGQSLAQDGGHSYDVMKATPETGAPVTLYFQIDRPMAWLSRALR